MTWKKKIAGTAAMFILGFIFILPVLWIVMNSIKTSPEIAADFLALPKSLYLDNFKNAMESMNFLVALKNSVVITLGAMLGGLFVSFAGAFGISHLRGKISQNLYLYFVFGQIVPFHRIVSTAPMGSTMPDSTPSQNARRFGIPSARRGMEMMAPSGKFWMAIPRESANAPAAVI